MAKLKKVTNKYNIGDTVYLPGIITGIYQENDHIYYSLKTESGSRITFRVYNPDDSIYKEKQSGFDIRCKDGMVRPVMSIVEEDLTKIGIIACTLKDKEE